MIKPDMAVKVRRSVPFDRAVALLVGTLAVVAALLSFVHMSHSHPSGRATVQGARLAEDLAARISASQQEVGFTLGAQQDALSLGIASLGRVIAGDPAQLPDEVAVGQADQAASQRLQEEITAMSATSGGPPVDAYTAALVTASIESIQGQLAQQQQQVTIASQEGTRGRLAVLGLSFAALAGVMAGLAAVLKEGRPGWAVLATGWVVGVLAAMAGVLSYFW